MTAIGFNERQLQKMKSQPGFVAVQQAKSGLMIGSLHDEFIHVPIGLLAGRQKSVDRTGPVWVGVLAATGQPERL